MTIKLVSQVCSNSSSEKAWSKFGWITHKKKNRLVVERANELMFVNANLRILSVVYDERKKYIGWEIEDESEVNLGDKDLSASLTWIENP